MAVDDGGTLTDDHAIGERDDHEMAGLAEIGRQPVRPDRLVEHILGNPHHKGVIAGLKPYDLHLHCVTSPKSAYKL
jgi:hypothetical protein